MNFKDMQLRQRMVHNSYMCIQAHTTQNQFHHYIISPCKYQPMHDHFTSCLGVICQPVTLAHFPSIDFRHVNTLIHETFIISMIT